MDRATEIAWGIIANAYGGDWHLASPMWREAAERWRDEFVTAVSESEEVEQEAPNG